MFLYIPDVCIQKASIILELTFVTIDINKMKDEKDGIKRFEDFGKKYEFRKKISICKSNSSNSPLFINFENGTKIIQFKRANACN